MSKSHRIVHTPGAEPVASEPESDADQTDGGTGEPESEADELARLRAENAALKADKDERAQRDAAIAASDKAAMSERLASNKPQAGLRASDVDPTQIKRAVLTLDGWVCPENSPTFSAQR